MCMYICVYICIHAYIYIYTCIYTYMNMRTHTHTYIYIYIYTSNWFLSSSSCHVAGTDIPDPLSPLLPIVHHLWQVLSMYVRAGRPAFARPYVGVHKSTSLMSSSLLLQQCPACLVRLTWIVFVIGGRWPYGWCLVGCCRQDLFNITRSILV